MTANRRLNDPDALRAEIARTRAELGATVEALAAKADVKGRARAAADRTLSRAKTDVKVRARAAADTVSARRTQVALAVGVSMVVGVLIALTVRARRR
ncbi:DUF3618 domain-containing protein [Dactylosporangium matsuzakiense]|uniref:DUF3618 domain-containing protein n=1 Tax=Dactylosporangium matsuzakiense TaxID=53360 RepID=A0A9W6KX16_9ACTN|nr:DUF3618 domain-containing protein [Dactylosporangium matsuzakiense]UWZ41455.1 DUF3618 domain-containing protein [Dactylosporangium matsuzakiense]GLL07014.1 hypothetical protein GCM10017581_087650 [Dactylosporangium matsuzakiense]